MLVCDSFLGRCMCPELVKSVVISPFFVSDIIFLGTPGSGIVLRIREDSTQLSANRGPTNASGMQRIATSVRSASAWLKVSHVLLLPLVHSINGNEEFLLAATARCPVLQRSLQKERMHEESDLVFLHLECDLADLSEQHWCRTGYVQQQCWVIPGQCVTFGADDQQTSDTFFCHWTIITAALDF